MGSGKQITCSTSEGNLFLEFYIKEVNSSDNNIIPSTKKYDCGGTPTITDITNSGLHINVADWTSRQQGPANFQAISNVYHTFRLSYNNTTNSFQNFTVNWMPTSTEYDINPTLSDESVEVIVPSSNKRTIWWDLANGDNKSFVWDESKMGMPKTMYEDAGDGTPETRDKLAYKIKTVVQETNTPLQIPSLIIGKDIFITQFSQYYQDHPWNWQKYIKLKSNAATINGVPYTLNQLATYVPSQDTFIDLQFEYDDTGKQMYEVHWDLFHGKLENGIYAEFVFNKADSDVTIEYYENTTQGKIGNTQYEGIEKENIRRPFSSGKWILQEPGSKIIIPDLSNGTPGGIWLITGKGENTAYSSNWQARFEVYEYIVNFKRDGIVKTYPRDWIETDAGAFGNIIVDQDISVDVHWIYRK